MTREASQSAVGMGGVSNVSSAAISADTVCKFFAPTKIFRELLPCISSEPLSV
ncbi:hypothetical protein LMG27177_07326 [Paraburkholderia fynbosensis]|uniref:Uncharacterized protein n=1 Tax=Paraburkholderia fynbosensis TaxID=1200993 RepID=A0A6J5H130_9BURK|nr:hypothetical protein LMG27177_07326 [Paraburkholderia fynbosensis]